MNKESTYGVLAFMFVFLATSLCYMKFATSTIEVNNQKYEQAGLMQYNNNGDTLYVPVFRRKN